jgi:transposase-like protein
MTKPIARDPMYRQRAFDADVIQLCVRWYITYRLSYRDLVEPPCCSMAQTRAIRRQWEASIPFS